MQPLQKQLDQVLAGLQKREPLLLHSCCGPCSSYVLEYLAAYFDITVFFYNPNIFPEQEYHKRVKEQKRLLACLDLPAPVKFIEGGYEPGIFLRRVAGLEQEPEGGARCGHCFALRLEKTVSTAAGLGFPYACTTLSVSPHKNAVLLHETLSRACVGKGVMPLPADFKKRGGYQRSIALSKEHGIYRQEYCGCPFSR